GLQARIEKKAVRVPPIFALIAKAGGIPERDMFNTFNMGVGMSVTVPADQADEAVRILKDAGEDAYLIGEIAASDGERIEIC
ncbi:MAG: phosphoribosylformylglycinamidine cyclo-ligase, partial [Clostridia bacterium]|nr:phosphoribosylformylglycinamidine cyclo-ligase [Clostridia bacterium]